MNIATIGTQLSELADKITDEKGLSNAAKAEIIKAVDEVDLTLQAVGRAITSLRNGIHEHFADREHALEALLNAPQEAPADQEKAA